MNMNELLPHIETNTFENPDKSVIWLHGLGADGNDFASIVPELHLPQHLKIRFIFPHAPVMPVSINNGYEMPAWFDIHPTGINSQVDSAGIQKSVQQINLLIQREQQRGIDPANIMLAGFSQGAVIALNTGILYPERLGGVIALSGLLPNAADIIAKGSAANKSLPLFIAHGTQDQVVSPTLGHAAAMQLKEAAYPVSWHTYPMAHSVCIEELDDISQWMQEVWKI
jgi:phospholipase/carboxylesterase